MDFSQSLINAILEANIITSLTGAGISKESGIPTFREAQTGLWAKYDPQQLATPQAFQRNPKLVWEWYQWRRSLIADSNPNPAHDALSNFEKFSPTFHLITQNVDGLHQQAGSTNVIELHGNIKRTICFDKRHATAQLPDDELVPPRCSICGSLLRPDVVWFGESLPTDKLEQAYFAAQNADVFLAIGTSALVEPAASLPHIAKQAGAIIIEINPDHTPLTPYTDHVLTGPAGDILPALLSATWPRKETKR